VVFSNKRGVPDVAIAGTAGTRSSGEQSRNRAACWVSGPRITVLRDGVAEVLSNLSKFPGDKNNEEEFFRNLLIGAFSLYRNDDRFEQDLEIQEQ
jgi:hypothetical protein